MKCFRGGNEHGRVARKVEVIITREIRARIRGGTRRDFTQKSGGLAGCKCFT
jgi:hypothetical protein